MTSLQRGGQFRCRARGNIGKASIDLVTEPLQYALIDGFDLHLHEFQLARVLNGDHIEADLETCVKEAGVPKLSCRGEADDLYEVAVHTTQAKGKRNLGRDLLPNPSNLELMCYAQPALVRYGSHLDCPTCPRLARVAPRTQPDAAASKHPRSGIKIPRSCPFRNGFAPRSATQIQESLDDCNPTVMILGSPFELSFTSHEVPLGPAKGY
jgi:hypothetical protein